MRDQLHTKLHALLKLIYRETPQNAQQFYNNYYTKQKAAFPALQKKMSPSGSGGDFSELHKVR
jgi:hypothetical protein